MLRLQNDSERIDLIHWKYIQTIIIICNKRQLKHVNFVNESERKIIKILLIYSRSVI